MLEWIEWFALLILALVLCFFLGLTAAIAHHTDQLRRDQVVPSRLTTHERIYL